MTSADGAAFAVVASPVIVLPAVLQTLIAFPPADSTHDVEGELQVQWELHNTGVAMACTALHVKMAYDAEAVYGVSVVNVTASNGVVLLPNDGYTTVVLVVQQLD